MINEEKEQEKDPLFPEGIEKDKNIDDEKGHLNEIMTEYKAVRGIFRKVADTLNNIATVFSSFFK